MESQKNGGKRLKRCEAAQAAFLGATFQAEPKRLTARPLKRAGATPYRDSFTSFGQKHRPSLSESLNVGRGHITAINKIARGFRDGGELPRQTAVFLQSDKKTSGIPV